MRWSMKLHVLLLMSTWACVHRLILLVLFVRSLLFCRWIHFIAAFFHFPKNPYLSIVCGQFVLCPHFPLQCPRSICRKSCCSQSKGHRNQSAPRSWFTALMPIHCLSTKQISTGKNLCYSLFLFSLKNARPRNVISRVSRIRLWNSRFMPPLPREHVLQFIARVFSCRWRPPSYLLSLNPVLDFEFHLHFRKSTKKYFSCKACASILTSCKKYLSRWSTTKGH